MAPQRLGLTPLPGGATAWPGRVGDPAEVEQVLAGVTTRAAQRAATAAVLRPVEQADDLNTDKRRHHLLPVHPSLKPLFPAGGPRHGSVVVAAGTTSLILALLATPTAAGRYAAVVNMPRLGALAADEYGVRLERLALVPDPGPNWAAITAILLDGLAMVVTGVDGEVNAETAQRLAARARRSGAVLVPAGPAVVWPGADVVLVADPPAWEGLGAGRGRLRRAVMTVTSTGRGAGARSRELVVPIPLPDPADMAPRRAARDETGPVALSA
ncbi:hypothetical protein [Phytohabitans rumicis]|uniref:hypothetical protein n=1 Tax=Phytohabitans rumicis TaxID=1076125 RepID=UPI0015668D51|nr:hypothetical protein [Phytohabitans rumicis]